MEHSKDLNSKKQGKAAALSLAGWNISNISKTFSRSRYVQNHLNQSRNTSGTGKIVITKKNVTHYMRRQILNASFQGMRSTLEHKDWLRLPIHRKIIRQVLHRNKIFKYLKAYCAQMLLAKHEFNHMQRARKQAQTSNIQWLLVIFSNVKDV